MSRPSGNRSSSRAGFPRVSGDEPSTVSGVVELNAFSPRERG